MFDTTLLAASTPTPVLKICEVLAARGHRAWIVGGIVRDLLSASARNDTSPPRGDWDLATDARPDDVQAYFRRVIPTGLQHGTVTVMIGGQGFEVTTLRGETTYSDGRHPDAVYFVNDIAADLARRDFTVNAIAYDPLANVLIDPYGGLDDLQRGLLRAVGDPGERFAEDGLRVLRAARFRATLDFEIDPDTARAMEPSLASYRKVSPERIRDEWLKALVARRPSRAFEAMLEHGLLAATAPELAGLVGVEQNRHHAFDVWEHTMRCLDDCPPRPLVRLAALLHDVAKPQTRAIGEKTRDYTFYNHEIGSAKLADGILRRLRFSNEERAQVVALVRHHLVVYDGSWTDATVRRWLRRVTPELVDELLMLNRADVLAKGRDVADEIAGIEALRERVTATLAAGAALTVRDLEIGGNDLRDELGLAPGPRMGQVLRSLLDDVTEQPELNERGRLLERARQLLANLSENDPPPH